MFRFENPMALQLLWLVPVFWSIWFFVGKMKHRKMLKEIGEKTYPFLSQSLSGARSRWKVAFEIFFFVFAILALARPQMGQVSKDIKSEGIELVFLVDVSKSMLAEDVKPSRLELAKKTLERIMNKVRGHKIGLIAFAGSAVEAAPMTVDYQALSMYIDSLSPYSVGTQGTRFALALSTAADIFKRGGLGKEEGSHATQAMVIVSDGEDNEPGALDLAKKLKEEGYVIYTIGVGTKKGAPIPERDERGTLKGYKKDKSGQPVLSTLKDGLLQDLAKMGGGRFFYATFSGDETDTISKSLSKLHKVEFEKKTMTDFDEIYQIFLLIAFLFGVFSMLLRTRRSKSVEWKGRFEVSLTFLLLMAPLVSHGQNSTQEDIQDVQKQVENLKKQTQGLGAQGPSEEEEAPGPKQCLVDAKLEILSSDFGDFGVNEYQKNKDGIEAFGEKRFATALERFTELYPNESENVIRHFNIANAFIASETEDKKTAIKEFEVVYKNATSPDLRYVAAFNLGIIYGNEKELDRALGYYQKALKERPDSQETKANIELLIQNQQQQQGGGEGEGDQNSDEDDKDGDKERKGPPKEPPVMRREVKKRFKSNELTERVVKDILEELEQQEQGIRKKLNKKKTKDRDVEKDW